MTPEQPSFQPCGEYKDAIIDWSHKRKTVERIEAQLIEAQKALREAESEVGRRWVPERREVGERFNVWVADGVLQITNTDAERHTYTVEWRVKPTPIAASKNHISL